MQYGFRSTKSTAYILTVIGHRTSKALDSTFDARAIALDISKAFDQVFPLYTLICAPLYDTECFSMTNFEI